MCEKKLSQKGKEECMLSKLPHFLTLIREIVKMNI